MKAKVTVGIISYNDQKYLEHNLPALLKQCYENYEIIVCNNNPKNGISDWIKEEFPDVKVVSAGGNVGFGKAHNFMISLSDAEYYLCFNSDMVASMDYIEKLMMAMEKNERIGCVTGKLISWSNFPRSPKEIEKLMIDTTGLKVLKDSRVIDRGQGEADVGQYEKEEEVFGASGASPLYRISALKDIQHSEEEYFDREFFMYKEDVDLAFRLRWAGWKTVYTPLAIAWHDRTAADIVGFSEKIKERRSRPAYIKRNSFLNQLITTKKNWSTDYTWATKMRIRMFIAAYMSYLLLCDPRVLSEIRKYRKMKKEIEAKREKMPRRISGREMEKWFV